MAASTANRLDQAEVEYEDLAMPVEGMTCASCVRRVEKAMRLVPGVADVSVNLAGKWATISFDPGHADPAALGEALFRAGKRFEFLPLAGFTHMVPDPEVTVRLQSRIVAFYKQHLGEPR